MNTPRLGNSASLGTSVPFIENLEGRTLFSTFATISPIPVGPQPPGTIVPVAPTPIALAGTTITALTNQSFKAVLGTINAASFARFPASYVLHGTINWGDGSDPTAATFQRVAGGTIDVIGSHTYAAPITAGPSSTNTDPITITITAQPPRGSFALIAIVGQIHSTANIINSPNGVTLEENAGVPFTAALGSFSSTLTGLTFTATINWGDGTTSVGKLIAEPVAFGQGGRYAVVGSHAYAKAASYHVTIDVTATAPPTDGNPTPDFILQVADIDSVVDVLPVSPVVAMV